MRLNGAFGPLTYACQQLNGYKSQCFLRLLLAAIVALWNTSRQIEATRALETIRRAERLESCWTAVRCEIVANAQFAEAYMHAGIGAVAYRVPQIVYEKVFLELLMLARLQDHEASPV